ncbi:MAG: FAD-dependent oxidoreductase [Candidatus Tectomicrobia bacterium]|uniref:FAD-dependent oxidoreductase n=1 Tax=Tectimicrobiota bacterium TaxID=2528274 RepID=A0A933GLL0_UNCTE|nr:FAD-dependent oxidoreductase [Candidatus Tectomicrobia bacterium]
MENISPKNIPYISVSTQSMAWNKTGNWRYLRPAYHNRLSPCVQGCPAGENIEGWMQLLQKKKYLEAFKLIREENPFPGVCGRVCFHSCEESCNRQKYDRALSINALERFLSDYILGSGLSASHWAAKPNTHKKERVAVIGAGPAGLSCAYHLSGLGYEVEIFESWQQAGGVLRYGIPPYRLPREILDWEIDAILAHGITLHTNMGLGQDFQLKDIRSKFKAIFIATGLTKGKKLNNFNENNERVISGLDFLRAVSLGNKTDLGEKVAIIGGGNTAIDSARTLLRLGVHPTIIYRRTRREMPAFDEELEEAEREGVQLRFLLSPECLVFQGKDLIGLECREMELSELDFTGRRSVIPRTGSNSFISADGVIVAVGEEPEVVYQNVDIKVGPSNTSITPDKSESNPKEQAGSDRAKKIFEDNPASHEILSLEEGIFQGGDLVGPVFNVTQAIASGKKVALMIDLYLKGEKDFSLLTHLQIGTKGGISIQRYLNPASSYAQALSSPAVKYEDLNLDYFPHSERNRRSKLTLKERKLSFKEVNQSMPINTAMEEAERCFHCGVCTQCDNCLIFCPDVSIISKASLDGYDIDFDHCKGCGICIKECPRAAMVIQGERK